MKNTEITERIVREIHEVIPEHRATAFVASLQQARIDALEKCVAELVAALRAITRDEEESCESTIAGASWILADKALESVKHLTAKEGAQ